MKARFQHIRKRLKVSGGFFLLVALFVLIVCWDRIVITTPPGHGGVVWQLLFGGTRTDRSLGEGAHLVLPWNRVYDYDLRLQNHRASYTVVTSDGLQLNVGVGFRWRANADNLGILHQKFGVGYLNTLMEPEIGSITRHVISRYDAADLVSERRNLIQQEIYKEVINTKNGMGDMTSNSAAKVVLLQDILIYEIDLPEPVRRAIEDKLRQAQVVQEYRFRVQREELESERKIAEAKGIRRFQEIVASNMSNTYLRWRGIEATLELARSPNSKIVVIGNQQSGGLPLILDAADKPGAPAKTDTQAKAAPAKSVSAKPNP